MMSSDVSPAVHRMRGRPFTGAGHPLRVVVAAPIRAVRSTGQLINTALARRARSYPSVAFARDGFVVSPGFLDASAAGTAVDELVPFTDRSRRQSGVPGVLIKDRADRQTRDLNVRQIFGAERISSVIAQLAASRRIEETIEGLTGLRLRQGRFVVQIDWPDTETKRGLHVDSHWPPTYKAFVYLTPVRGPENGPFSVVPGSHRDRLKKLRAIAADYRSGRPRTDMDAVYSLAEAQPLLGEPGTAIFADQRLAPTGWPGHTTGPRLMVVAYLYSSG